MRLGAEVRKARRDDDEATTRLVLWRAAKCFQAKRDDDNMMIDELINGLIDQEGVR